MAEAVNREFSLRMSGFDPRQIRVKFVVYQMALGPVSPQAHLSPPRHFHSINGPYSFITSHQLKLILATSSTIELHTYVKNHLFE